MVKLIVGEKGSGKTSHLISMLKEAVEEDKGSVVCIEAKNGLTYDIPYQARLISTNDYGINTYDQFKGFLCGIHSGNYDISHFYIDDFFKIVKDDTGEQFFSFIDWVNRFSESVGIEVVLTITMDPSNAPEKLKPYVI